MTSEICKMGPPVDSVNRWFLCGLTMVYGRYNELVFMEIIMVYKPTFTSLGAPSCVDDQHISQQYGDDLWLIVVNSGWKP